MSDGQVVIDITADDSKFKSALSGLGKVAVAGLAALTTALVGIGVASLNAAINFNKGMANVASLIPGSTARVNELKGTVQEMAVQFGKSTDDLSEGLYNVISAFGDTADTAKIMETNVKAATAGVATTTDAINLTSAVTKAYGDTSAEAVEKAADLALMTVRLGQTTFPELAASVGKVTPLTNELGVSQEELFATMATLTGVTGGAAEVSTQLRGAMQSLMAPTDSATKAIKAAGYEDAKAMLAKEGLAGSMKILMDAAEKSGEPLNKYISSIEGQTLALALGGPQADAYAEKLGEMEKAAGATDAAFKEQTEGVNAFGFKLDQLKQVGVTSLQKIGDALISAFGEQATAGIDKVMKFVNSFFGDLELGLTPLQSIRGAIVETFGPEMAAKFDQLRDVVDNIIGIFTELSDWFSDNSGEIESFGGKVFDLATGIGSSEGAVKGLIGALVTWKALQIAGSIASTVKAIASMTKATVLGTIETWKSVTAKIADKVETLAIAALIAKDTIARGLNTVAVIAGTAAQKAAALASKAWAAAQWLLNAAMTANPIGLVIAGIVLLVGAIVYAWKNSETFRRVVTAAWNAVWGAIKAAAAWIAKAVPAAFKAVLDFVMKYSPLGFLITNWSAIRAALAGAANKAKEAVVTAFRNLVDGAKQRASDLVSFVKGIPGKLIAAIGNLKDKFLGIGSDIVAGLRQGLQNKWDGLVGKLKGLANLLPAAVKKLLGIASPSRVFTWIAEMITKGWSGGLDKGRNAVVGAVEKTVAGIIKAADSPILESAFSFQPSTFKPATYRPVAGAVAVATGSSATAGTVINHIEQNINQPVRTHSEMLRAGRELQEGLVR